MIYSPAYETAEYEQIGVFPKGEQGYYLLIKRSGGVEQVPPETQNLDHLLKECTIVASQDILDQFGDDVTKFADMCPRFNIVDGKLVEVPRYTEQVVRPFTEILDGIKNHLWKPASDHKVTHED